MSKNFWYRLLLGFGVALILWGLVGLLRLHWNDPSSLSSIVYILVGATAIFSFLFIRHAHRAEVPGHLGISTGSERGPAPGDGAVIHHSSGEADFDGLAGDVPPPVKEPENGLPYPPHRSAD